MKDVAVLHHRYKNYGGGERVADRLADATEGDLYTLWVDGNVREETNARALKQERYSGRLGKIRRSVKAETILRAADIEDVDLSEYDTVITSGDMAHCYLPADGQRHIHYLHTPNRDYFVGEEMRDLTRGAGRSLKTLLMQWQRIVDQSHAAHVDSWLCNSDFIEKRAETFYGVSENVEVCYPPVDWEAYGPALEERSDYYVTVGRVVPDKRVNRIVDTFRGLEMRLVVCGDGRDRTRLEKEAPKNVEFRGYVDEETKRRLVRNAKGFVFAGARECFGMAVAEALSAGTPVIAADSGNMPNLVNSGNGVLVDVDELAAGIERVEMEPWDYSTIREEAKQYAGSRFDRQIRDCVMGGSESETRLEVSD